MSKCPNCGSDIPDGNKFCRICGTALAQEETVGNVEAAMPEQAPAEPAPAAPAAPAYTAPAQPTQPAQPTFTPPAQPAQPAYTAPAPTYTPPAQPAYTATQPIYNQTTVVRASSVDEPGMTWGAFFWTRVLFSIPIVGFIFVLIWSFGGSANRTRVHYARSYLFPGLIIFGILLVVFIILAITGSSGDLFKEIKRLF